MTRYAPLLLVLLLVGAGAWADAPARPNIIFFMIDDCSTHEFGCYGAPGNPTPNMDRLAATGLRFTSAWATPLCMPTRMLVLTGQYAFQNGVYDNNLADWPKNERLLARTTTLGKALQQRGYRTMQVGKWHLPGYPWDAAWGFDEQWLYGSLGPMKPEWAARYRGKWWQWSNANVLVDTQQKWHSPLATWQPMILHNGEYVETTETDFGPELMFAGVREFLERQARMRQPFFIYYAEHLTHTPWTEMRDPVTGGKTKPGIVENVQYTDHLLGRLEAELKRLGLWDNTVLVIGADNPTQGLGKARATAIGAHVPLIVAGGAKYVTWSGVTDCLMDYSDLYPTFLDLAGGNPAVFPDLNGRSFRPLLAGEREYSRPWIFSYLGPYRMIRNRDWCLDGANRLWRCPAGSDPFQFALVARAEETEAARQGRRALEAVLATLPAPVSLLEKNPQLKQAYEKNLAGEINGPVLFADRQYAAGIRRLMAQPCRLTYHCD